MPADFFIDPQLQMVFSKATGVCSLAEALDHMNRLQAHPEFNPDYNQLFDYRELTEMALTSGEIRQLALRTIFSPRSRRAFVAPHDDKFGLSRMFATYREMAGEPGIHVFREMPEALEWLPLSAEPDPGLFIRLQSGK